MTNQELKQARDKNVPRGPFNVTHLFAAKASNATITDVEGRDFIDFAGGIGVMGVGHCHPKVVAATQDQAALFSHTCFHVVMYEPYVQARRMNEATPGDFEKKTLLLNSGAEAVENAVKIARAATGRAGIGYQNGFHGRTLIPWGSPPRSCRTRRISVRSQPTSTASPTRTATAARWARSIPSAASPAPSSLSRPSRTSSSRRIAAYRRAGQGEGGFIAPPQSTPKMVKDICESNGIMYIADEVQCGFGRTGKMFAMEHWGVAPI